MNYRAKAFPYPVLAEFNDDFIGDTKFDSHIEFVAKNPGEQIVEIQYILFNNSDWLDEYVLDGKARIVFDVDCRSTFYREYIQVHQLDGTLTFNKGELYGVVEVTPLILATEQDEAYRPEGVHPEFGSASFQVREGDILAIGSTHTASISFERNVRGGSTTINFSNDLEDLYKFEYSGNRIIIHAGSNLRNLIQQMKGDSKKTPYLFMSIFKDCFSGAIREIVKTNEQKKSDPEMFDSANELSWGANLIDKLEELRPNLNLESLNSDNFEIFEELAQLLAADLGVRSQEDYYG